MSTSSQTLALSASISNAEFQAFNTWLSAQLTACGITKTGDSGQIDPATANFPGTNNTTAGYEIREFTDTLAGTDPVVMRIDYMRGGNANFLDIGLTFGTGSDGTGTITGVKQALQQWTIATNHASANYDFSGGDNRFAIMSVTNVNTGGARLGVERTLDSNGDVTNRGILIHHSRAGTLNDRVVEWQGGTSQSEVGTGGSCLCPSSQTSGLAPNGNVAVYPYFFFAQGETLVAGKNFCGAYNADFTNGNQYTVELLGTNHNMKFWTGGTSLGSRYPPTKGGSPNTVGVMMRWE